MKTLQEFQRYFERELRPALINFRAERDATRPHFFRVWPWWLVTALVLSFSIDKFPPLRHTWWVTAPMLLMWLTTIWVVPVYFFIRNNRWNTKYGGREKKVSVEPAIRFLAPEFEYKASQHVPEQRVRTSRIFALYGDITEMGGDDLFTGRIGETAVEFSEVWVGTTGKFESIDKDAKLPTYIGLFLVADFSKPFQHATLVMPEPGQQRKQEEFARLSGGLSRSTIAPKDATAAELNWQRLRLENLEFDRLFAVHATDRVEAYYILTPDVMERLTAFRERTRYGLTLSFVGTAMHAFIHCGPLFEGNLDADVTKFAAYQPYYEQLRLVFDLVEVMKLNTRLWGKS